ncbi:YeiH family protein [Streptacidiphilus neutrinimicus]|uniref:YeiH family protein n=1 Tax=Streptacidiphilus neutrinimicus TaxID=105420 RepID=UPI001EED2C71|nr:putative sulfate exporter family transporter [Streptacidiphilus neutrinimicus]
MTITPVRPDRRGSVQTPPSAGLARPSARLGAPLRRNAPGLVVAAAATGMAAVVNHLAPSVSPMTAAVALGVLAGNLRRGDARLLPAATRPGLGVTAKRVMRLAVVLLGLKLALSDILALGWPSLVLVCLVVAATFFGAQWLGRKAGLPGDQPLLIATGFSICGASAVAAMNGVTESEEQDTVTAVALVTLCGTLAIGVLPLLHHPLGLTDLQFGRWTGASVHDVGQVVAIGQTAGAGALGQAVVVKLMRVALLAPLVTGVALMRSRRAGGRAAGQNRPAPIPLFLVGFLACVALRSTGVLSAGFVNTAGTVDELLTAAALFALGSTVDVRNLLRTGRKALLVGLASWVLIAAVSYVGVLLTS